MKTRNCRFLIGAFAIMVSIFCILPMEAQKRKMPDKSIVGTWVLVSMRYDGESKRIECGKDYSQIKYYGPTGEYACAEIVKNKNTYIILPHDYGTYTYNNGKYTEMGRRGVFIIKGKTASGRWYNRHEVWKKVTLPEALRKEIIFKCKANTKSSPQIQKMIHQYILNK